MSRSFQGDGGWKGILNREMEKTFIELGMIGVKGRN